MNTWTPDPAKRRIVCAACLVVRSGDQEQVLLVGPRHWDQIMHTQATLMGLTRFGVRNFVHEEQGFVDQWGTFFDRREALAIASRAGQLDGRVKSGNPDSDELFSEDLY